MKYMYLWHWHGHVHSIHVQAICLEIHIASTRHHGFGEQPFQFIDLITKNVCSFLLFHFIHKSVKLSANCMAIIHFEFVHFIPCNHFSVSSFFPRWKISIRTHTPPAPPHTHSHNEVQGRTL